MRWLLLLALCLALAFMLTAFPLAQEAEVIGAGNIGRLRSAGHIDFADFANPPEVGFFAANADATEFIVFDRAQRIYAVGETAIRRSWSYLPADSESVFALIDASYIAGQPHILYLLDGTYFINDYPLPTAQQPVALFAAEAAEEIVIEALDSTGGTVFLRYGLERGELRWLETIAYPAKASETPQLRIVRIDFPLVIMAALVDGGLTVYRYPSAFGPEKGRRYSLENGPAVFGAVNGAVASHFAWGDAARNTLNLLDLATGENRLVAELAGAYAQHFLLTADASVLIIVNLDFQPEVFAWAVSSGQRYDLGPYRSCQRIPDKVALSADGRALIIGCDTGLDIWRVAVD